jgi:signal transduction histidine kinase
MSEPEVKRWEEPAELLTRLDELRQAERRAASARVASVIGHLIGTPLNVIAGRAALIRSNPTADAVTENARRIEEQVERLAQRIRGLIEYLGVSDPPLAARSVGQVIDEAMALYEPLMKSRGLSVARKVDGVGQANVDLHASLLVLTSLLSLAARSSKSGAVIELDAEAGGARTVAFRLTVPAVPPPPARVDRLEPPEGAGYEADAMQVLSICFATARRCGGSFDAGAAPSGDGLVARFECPRLSG